MRASLVARPWAGLDLGSFGVKLVVLHGSRVAAAEVAYPAGPPSENGPAPDAVVRAVAEAAGRAGVNLRTVRGLTVGIAGPDVIIKQIQLPLMDEAEVGQALRFEARKHLPFDPASMVIDYQVLGRFLSERRIEVLIAAVAREHLERHLAPLARLDLATDIVDAAPLALTNAAVQGGGDRNSCLLLDIGHASSHLTLFQRGEPYFSRRLDFGGRHLTRAIAARLEVPFEEAEEWKLAAGSEQPGFRVDWSCRELMAVHDALSRGLVNEVRHSLAFYRTVGHLPENPRLLLSGGTARLPGLAERLANLLEFPVSVFDPLGDHTDDRHGPQYTQAFGLALRTS
jgi:type IV pilus assembly protein PilM